MKKLLVLLLALCMVFALAACDPQPEEQPIDPNKDEIAVDPMEILESGEYYIEFTLHTMGMEADGIITALDDRYFSSIDLFGIISKTLTIGEDMYFLNDLDKTYTISKIADAALDAANHFLPESFDGLLEIDSGSSIIEDMAETDSTVYEYVEYSLPEDISLRLYFDGKKFHAMSVNALGVTATLVIEVFSSDADKDLLTVPEDYTEVAAE